MSLPVDAVDGGRSSDNSAALPTKCHECREPLATPLFCGACHALLQETVADHFAAIGIARRYEIDAADLRRRYLALSREVHPDRAAQAGLDPSAAARVSSRLNEAMRVLSDDLLRAEYLLEISGGPSATADKSVPGNVLTETLELREEIDEARHSGGAERLGAIRAQLAQQHTAAMQRVAALARQVDQGGETLKLLRAELNAIKYLRRLREEAARVEI